MKRYIYHIRNLVSVVFLCAIAQNAQAITYTKPLTNIPGVTDAETLNNLNIATFLNGIITLLFSLSGIAAVVMISIIGFSYITKEASPMQVGKIKKQLESLLWGIGIIASTYIILKLINPNLIDLNILKNASENEVYVNEPSEAEVETDSGYDYCAAGDYIHCGIPQHH